MEIAKRTWFADWVEMNDLLKEFYVASPVTKQVTLIIIQQLCEDIFIYEDPQAQLRKRELTTAMLCVTISANVLSRYLTKSSPATPSKTGHDGNGIDYEKLCRLINKNQEKGWLNVFVEELVTSFSTVNNSTDPTTTAIASTLAHQIIATLSVMFDWVLDTALMETQVASVLLSLLNTKSMKLRLSLLDALLVLSSRAFIPATVLAPSASQFEARSVILLQPFLLPVSAGPSTTPSFGLKELIKFGWIDVFARFCSQPIKISESDFTQLTIMGEEVYVGDSSSTGDEDVKEHGYKIIRRVTQILAAIASKQLLYKTGHVMLIPSSAMATSTLSALDTQFHHNWILVESFDYFIQSLVLVSRHPSILVLSNIVSAWADLLKVDGLVESDSIVRSLPLLIDVGLSVLTKDPRLSRKTMKATGSSSSVKDRVKMEYILNDFVSDTEFIQFRDTLGIRWSELLRSGCLARPADCVGYICGKFNSALEAIAKNTIIEGGTKRDAFGYIAEQSLDNFVLKAHTQIFESVVSTLHTKLAAVTNPSSPAFLSPLSPSKRSMTTSSPTEIAEKNAEKLARLHQLELEFAQYLLSYNTSDPTVSIRIISCLGTMGSTIGRMQQMTVFTQIIEKLFTMAVFTYPDETEVVQRIHERKESGARPGPNERTFLRYEGTKLRNKSMACLSRLGSEIPDLLMSQYDVLVQFGESLITNKKLLHSERVGLVEFFTGIVYHANGLSYSDRLRAFNQFIGPYVSELNSSLFENIANDSKSLLDMMGVDYLVRQYATLKQAEKTGSTVNMDIKDELHAFKRQRGHLMSTMNALASALRRTIHIRQKQSQGQTNQDEPWNEVALQIFGRIAMFCRSLNGIWDPQHWTNAPSELKQILEMSSYEVDMILGTSKEASAADQTDGDNDTGGDDRNETEEASEIAFYTVPSIIKSIQAWISGLRGFM